MNEGYRIGIIMKRLGLRVKKVGCHCRGKARKAQIFWSGFRFHT